MPSAILTLGNAQRAQLKALQAETSGHLRSHFEVAQQRAVHTIRTFTRAYGEELDRLRAEEDDAGDPMDPRAKVPSTWLHTHGLSDVQRAVKASVATAAVYSLQATRQAQGRAATDGQRNAHALIVASVKGATPKPIITPSIPPQVVGYTFRKPHHEPLTDYFDPLDDLAYAQTAKVASNGAASGWLADALAAALYGVFTSAYYRADTIADAESTGAYRGMVTLSFRENPFYVKGWQWRAQPDACDYCADLNGTLHGIDEDMDSHPHCRCWQEPFSTDPRDQEE